MIEDRMDVTGLRDDGIPQGELNELQLREIHEFKERLQTGIYREMVVDVCCLCECTDAILVAAKDRYGLPVKTVVCTRCGLVRTLNPLDEESFSRFYADQYRNLYEGTTFSSEERQRLLEDQFRRNYSSSYIRKLQLDSTSLVAEVGAGAGWNLYSFHKEGIPVIGCDFDRDYLDYGRQKGCNLLEGSIKVLVNAGMQADFVIVNHVLEHVLDPIDFLLDVRKILKDDGYVFIGAPGLVGVRYGYGDGDFWGCLQNAHTFFFELHTLRQCMAKTEFSFVEGHEWLAGLFRKQNQILPYTLPKWTRGSEVVSFIRSLRYSGLLWKVVWKSIGGNSLTKKGRMVSRIAYSLAHSQWAFQRLRQRFFLQAKARS